MLFDAIINLFKTICIGAIAFSPVLVYKILDEPPAGHYQLTGVSNEETITIQDPTENSSANGNSSPNRSTGIFSNTSFFNTSPPPPPPPPADVPMDSFYYLLVLGMVATGLKYRNLLSEYLKFTFRNICNGYIKKWKTVSEKSVIQKEKLFSFVKILLSKKEHQLKQG